MEKLYPNGKPIGRILIVEDNALVRNLLAEVLAQQGHLVESVEDGQEALSKASSEMYDLVITDIHLPGLSGLDIISRLKALQPAMAVIVITGYPSLSKAVTAIKQGAKDFITKPFNIRHISDLVQDTLQEKQLLGENILAERNNQAVIEKLNSQLQQKVNQLTKLYTISESFHSHVDNHAMFQYIVELAAELTNARRVSLMSFDPSRRHLVIRAAIGLPADVQNATVIEMGQGVAGRVARQARLLRVPSIRSWW